MNFEKIALLLALSLLSVSLFAARLYAASPSPALSKARQESSAKGYIFAASHDEIVAKAKQEGALKVLSSLDPEGRSSMAAAFKKKYPFINLTVHEITGTETVQQHLLEVKAGTASEWDVTHVTDDFYGEFVRFGMKLDILGMAQEGVLAINPRMVDPEHRNMVAVSTAVCALAYNRNRLAAESVPNRLDDFLKPEFKGKKFLVEIRPHCMASLVPALGAEWVVDYARKIKDQQPVFVRGPSRAATAIAVGEYNLQQLTNYHGCVRAARRDRTQSLMCKIIEPVPARIQELQLILATAAHPYAALLFFEHTASPEGQRIIDEFEPLKSSIYGDGEVAKLIKGKKISINDFSTYDKAAKWMELVIEAYGFPKAELR